MNNFERAINKKLDSFLTESNQNFEIFRPHKLVSAMRHAVFNGGKRLRPYLMVEIASFLGANKKSVFQTACALECLHCYSLVHDDLPAMDNDDLRRGKLTVHRKFDEATAILTGDALLTLSFDLIASDQENLNSDMRVELTMLLARAAGLGGMVGGQILDLEAEGRTLNQNQIHQFQSMKTGTLIRFACEAGAIIGQANKNERAALVKYGEIIGLAFQLSDDLLDVLSTEENLGKAVSKDHQRGKKTIVSLMKLESAQKQMKNLISQANDQLKNFGERARVLNEISQFIGERKA